MQPGCLPKLHRLYFAFAGMEMRIMIVNSANDRLHDTSIS
jgi:hypothetical protein